MKKVIAATIATAIMLNSIQVSAADGTVYVTSANYNLDISVSGVTSTTASLSWNDIDSDIVYEILLNGELVTSDYVGTAYELTGLSEGSGYEIQICAFNAMSGEYVSESSTKIYTDLSVSAETTIYSDTIIGDLSVTKGTFNLNGNNLTVESLDFTGGTLDLNGGTLTVKGDVTQSGGTMNVNGGQLIIDGDYSIVSDSYCYGTLNMAAADSYILVCGNFTTCSAFSHNGKLNEGVLEIKGDFKQSTFGNDCNFYASGNHKVILSGNKKQTVSIQSINTHFAALELCNFSVEGVEFSTRVPIDNFVTNGCVYSFADGSRAGWTLETDEEITGDIILSGGILDLNSNKLTINGNLIHTDGEVFVNGGELVVNGDYIIQSTDGESSNGTLNMTNESDAVTVSGNFVMQSSKSHSALLTSGTLTVGGDFTQKNGNNNNYHVTGSHTTVLNGTAMQTVTIAKSSATQSHFNNFKMDNTSTEGIVFKQDVYVTGMLMHTESVFTKEKLYLATGGTLENGVWNTDLNITGNITLPSDWTINGNLKLQYSRIDLNGKTLGVMGDVTQIGGTLDVNSGKLFINGDYNLTVNNSYLLMTAPEDYVYVGGNFITSAYYSNKGKLTAGVLEIKGDFSQTVAAYDNGAFAEDGHKVILSGEQKQTVTFASENLCFNILEITKSLENGYAFSRIPLWNELIERNIDTEAPSVPVNLKAADVTSLSVELVWDESADNIAVSGYYVYCNGAKIADVSVAQYTHNGLTSDTVYQYCVQAYDVEQNLSEVCDSIEVSTKVTAGAPSSPKNIEVEITEEGILISWSASDSSNLAEYRIYRNDICIDTTTELSYMDISPEQGVYSYYIIACDDEGKLSVKTAVVTVDIEPPTAPVLSLEMLYDTAVRLTWSTPAADIKYYEVYRNGSLLMKCGKNEISDYNLSEKEQYEYYVIAYDTSGNVSEPSETVIFNINDTEKPVVTAITPNSGRYSGSVKVVIKAQDNIAVSDIVLQVSQDKITWLDAEAVKIPISNKTIITSCMLDTELYSDGYLYLRAAAYDTSGNMSESYDVTAELEINNTKPKQPSAVSAELKEGYAEVSWESTDADVQYFRLYRSTGGDYSLLKDKYNYRNYFEENPEVGIRYSYYVTSVNSYGCESEPSETVEIIMESDDILPAVMSVYPRSGASISENQEISVSCSDNCGLFDLNVEIALSGSEQFSEIFSAKLSSYHEISTFNLNTDSLEDGEYTLRFTVSDKYGNISIPYTAQYIYESCKLSAPELTAVGEGWRSTLSWTMSETDDLEGYIIYRKSEGSGNYSVIEKIIGTAYSDGKVTAGESYSYKIGAVDSRGNIVYSNEADVTPLDMDDTPPIANAGIDLYTVAGRTVSFNGTKSFDNCKRIASYLWDFGDGTKGTGSSPKHSYSEEGIYTATLEVTDSTGNSHVDTAIVTVRGSAYCMAEFYVSSEGGARLSDVMVYCEGGLADETYITDSQGYTAVFAETGIYDVYFCKDGYLPVHKEIDIKTEMEAISVTMEEKELVTGELTVKELEYSEMKALGIDIYAPENQHVFKYTTTITFRGSSEKGTLTFYVNKEGEYVKSKTTHIFTDCNGRTGIIYAVPVNCWRLNGVESEPAVAILKITAGFSWTKEFFDVELTILNNASEEFTIENSYATLNLPEGLSIADTYLGTELTREMGTIAGGSSKSASWIVRGDKKGQYHLTADFSGMLMPFNENITASFKTSEPLVVEGGDALFLNEVRNMIKDWEHWDLTYNLTNVSDKPVHGVLGSLSGYLGFGNISDMMMVYPNGRTIMLEWEGTEATVKEVYFDALNYSEDDGLDTLQPGESLIIYLTLDLELT